MNLFLLPFAGGSRYSFMNFTKFAPPHFNLIPVDYPGRGGRITEPLLTDIHAVVEDMYQQIKGQLQAPYAIYGHSMGSTVAIYLTKKLAALGDPLPIHLFVSGCGGPSEADDEEDKHTLEGEAFKAKLEELGGVPQEVLDNKDLFNFFEPILRADFKANETFVYEPSEPLEVPITAMIGLEDKTPEDIARTTWQQETVHPLVLKTFSGGHFFIFDHTEAIMRVMVQTLQDAK